MNEQVHQAHVELLHIWLKDIVFTWHWWIDLSLTILPWILWLKVRKKESTHRYYMQDL